MTYWGMLHKVCLSHSGPGSFKGGLPKSPNDSIVTRSLGEPREPPLIRNLFSHPFGTLGRTLFLMQVVGDKGRHLGLSNHHLAAPPVTTEPKVGQWSMEPDPYGPYGFIHDFLIQIRFSTTMFDCQRVPGDACRCAVCFVRQQLRDSFLRS